MGRPDTNRNFLVSIYITKEQKDFIQKVSKMSRQSVSSYLRDLVEMERQMQSTPVRYDSVSGIDYTLMGRCKRWLTSLFL